MRTSLSSTIHIPILITMRILRLVSRLLTLQSPFKASDTLRSRIRSRQSPSSSLTALQTSFKPSDTLRSLRGHRWSYYDAHYLFLIILLVFALSMIERPGALVKTAVATLLLVSLILPITRQFFLPFLPIATWLIFFYSCQ